MSEKSTAIFAAGCFWGVQYYFDQVPGVLETEVGYIGRKTEEPTYEQVCGGSTGHAEAIKVIYDADKITFEQLLKHFFRMHDPTQLNRQGPDVGEQYRSAIFYADARQMDIAQKMIEKLNIDQFKGRIATSLEPDTAFWRAEDYHQKFTERTGRGMCHVPYREI